LAAVDVDTDLAPHLEVLLDELTAALEEEEAINARSSACAYWHAAQTCERFLLTPSAILSADTHQPGDH
jgi:hypothetical protein